MAAPPHAFRVDAQSIAYAGFRREGEVYAVGETAETPLPSDTFHEGLLGGPPRDAERFRAAVAELVGGLSHPPREASLVLPDAWLRVAFADLAAPPDGGDEVLRWKLKRLVPFRVDELRLTAQSLTPLPQQPDDEPYRVLLGFAGEALLAQIEDAFAAAGVRLGRITSASLALVSALARRLSDDTLTAVALVEDGGYALAFVRGGEPVLHRYKALAGGMPEGARDGLVLRDLRLTRGFLAEQVPGMPIGRALVAAPGPERGPWSERLAQALDAPAEAVGRDHLPPLDAAVPRTDWNRLAPLLGAVAREVA
ncbi:MAG TPA: hypothetical protein VHM02_09020 [Thermoanaerobaculia bacterium]|nr:hypothetical protein [Thermoanaerobaculia bacterium]